MLRELRRPLLGEFDEPAEGAVAAPQQPARGQGGEKVPQEHGQTGQQAVGGGRRRGGRAVPCVGVCGGRVEPGVGEDPGGVGGGEGRGPDPADQPRRRPDEGVVGLGAQGEPVLPEAEEDVQSELPGREGADDGAEGAFTSAEEDGAPEDAEEAGDQGPGGDARARREGVAQRGQHDADRGEHRGPQQPWSERGGRHGGPIIAPRPPPRYGRSGRSHLGLWGRPWVS